ncbi:hypothetical protein [Magnetococcus sp. PR-3]|uniref:hypothetical protein n=1 Tax=Magnetococcus sp. PR-3 TaxID=3120355 RepID=UPI002FCE453D
MTRSGYGMKSMVLTLVGGALLLANLLGLGSSLRSPDAPASSVAPGMARSLTQADVLTQLQTPPAAGELEMARATLLVNKAMLHGSAPVVPFTENWILWFGQFVLPQMFDGYEFRNPDKALERGVGLCSQSAIALTGVLERQGVKSRIIGLDGHVVASGKHADGRWWTLDPDYGVVMPLSLAQLQKEPALALAYYLKAGVEPNEATRITAFYNAQGNRIYAGPKEYGRRVGIWKYRMEITAYYLKWIIPVLLLGWGGWRLYRHGAHA